MVASWGEGPLLRSLTRRKATISVGRVQEVRVESSFGRTTSPQVDPGRPALDCDHPAIHRCERHRRQNPLPLGCHIPSWPDPQVCCAVRYPDSPSFPTFPWSGRRFSSPVPVPIRRASSESLRLTVCVTRRSGVRCATRYSGKFARATRAFRFEGAHFSGRRPLGGGRFAVLGR